MLLFDPCDEAAVHALPLYMRHAADPSHNAVEFAMLNTQQSPEVHCHCKKSFSLDKLPAFVFMHRNEVQPALEMRVLTFIHTQVVNQQAWSNEADFLKRLSLEKISAIWR